LAPVRAARFEAIRETAGRPDKEVDCADLSNESRRMSSDCRNASAANAVASRRIRYGAALPAIQRNCLRFHVPWPGRTSARDIGDGVHVLQGFRDVRGAAEPVDR
jgi:hypothetical protein